jgi:hypothetical protein
LRLLLWLLRRPHWLWQPSRSGPHWLLLWLLRRPHWLWQPSRSGPQWLLLWLLLLRFGTPQPRLFLLRQQSP